MTRFTYRRLALAAASAAYLAAPAAASTLTKLYQFSGGSDGGSPAGPLRLDSAGNLYGTTTSGGSGNGVVFRLTPAASAPWTETVLYRFPPTPRLTPSNGGLFADVSGALYGTINENQTGFVFRLTPPATGTTVWRFAKLFAFPGPSSSGGGGPSGRLSVDEFGDLVGVTQAGGDQSGPHPCRCGVVYGLAPPADGGGWRQSVLYTFTSLPDGNVPLAGLTTDSAGALYGTTYQGGSGKCLDGSGVAVIGCGTVFKISPSASGWTETQLYSFRIGESNQPTEPVVLGPDGALYGVALLDVFRLAADLQGTWHKRTIFSFGGGVAGTAPAGGVLFDPAGNIYGATRSFGIYGSATVYKLSPPAAPGQGWTETTLVTLTTSFDGPQPNGGLTRGRDGTLYGAAGGSFAGQPGYIFAVSP